MPNEITIKAIHERYKDEWVVVKVTKRDKYFAPAAGEVLLHGFDKEKVYDHGFRFRRENPEVELYFFFTGEIVPEDMAVMLNAI